MSLRDLNVWCKAAVSEKWWRKWSCSEPRKWRRLKMDAGRKGYTVEEVMRRGTPEWRECGRQ